MIKSCGVCGLSCDWKDSRFFSFAEIRSIYSVGFTQVCAKCGKKADSFISYYGEKKQKDLAKLHQFLASGVAAKNYFSALMNAGYTQ
jgi:hypothetical protein